jgi:tetratricopeptide (TPR) repeat protein
MSQRIALLLLWGAVACGPGDGAGRPHAERAEPAPGTAPPAGLPAHAVAPGDTTLQRADQLLDEGHWQEALALYQQLPATAAALRGMGIAQLRLWDLKPAIRTLTRARALAPRDPEIGGYLAEALTLDRQLDDALLVYREMIELDPTNVDLRASYALALAWSGDHAGAEREYRAALHLEPEHFRSRHGLAEVLSWRRDFDAALAEYRRALAGTTDLRQRSRALTGTAQVLAWQGDLRQAGAEYRRAIEANPRNTDALFGLAEVHEWQREYPAAKRLYEEILQIDPRHAGAQQKLLQLSWVQ